MIIKLDGFHGTNDALVGNILKNGFMPSLGYKEWLGDGSYFFLKGLNKNPQALAEEWAKISAWDKKKKENKYLWFAVLYGKIEVEKEKFLDLTTAEGIEILDYVQEKCISKLTKIGKKLQYIDGFLINFARGEQLFDIEVTKGNFYIKLKKEDRKLKLSRRTPNCTICAVYNSEKNIINVEKIKKGKI